MAGELASFVKQTYTVEQIELIKRTVCVGASNDELALFVQQCKQTGLNPFARQIHAVFRNAKEGQGWVKKMSIQVGIDGYRLIADRTGFYEGQTPTQWCGKDGVWVDVWLGESPPAAARVGVFRKGFKEPVYRVATYSSFCQTTKDGGPNSMWAKMPDVMLAKCAESLALRTAFPQETSGTYSDDEMPPADPTIKPVVDDAEIVLTPPTKDQLKAEMERTGRNWGWCLGAINMSKGTQYKIGTLAADVDQAILADFFAWLKEQPAAPAKPPELKPPAEETPLDTSMEIRPMAAALIQTVKQLKTQQELQTALEAIKQNYSKLNKGEREALQLETTIAMDDLSKEKA